MRRRIVGRITPTGFVDDEPANAIQKERFSAMLIERSPPRALTDREFLEGRGSLLDQFGGDKEMLQVALKRAHAAGVHPSDDDVYMPSLADEIGDPLAFVPSGNARNHIKKVCELKNLECRGAVTHKRRETAPTPDVPLAESIVKKDIAELKKKDRYAATQDYGSLRQEVIKRAARQPHLPG